VAGRRFEEHRPHLRAVAYRMLGSLPEAGDAVQDAWLRLKPVGCGRGGEPGRLADDGRRPGVPEHAALACRPAGRPGGRARARSVISHETVAGPEDEALLSDSVGLALIVVLDTLALAERLALVLHDMFDVPFEEIALMVGRSPAAARSYGERDARGAARTVLLSGWMMGREPTLPDVLRFPRELGAGGSRCIKSMAVHRACRDRGDAAEGGRADG
jgi:RNA polymerase sigma-70 factor (ECF subfamily)